MPFDSVPKIVTPPSIDVFVKRREAAAALWREMPVDKLKLNVWECGSTACALGWLAMNQHDGWHFSLYRTDAIVGRIPIGPGGRWSGIEAAMMYFRLDYKAAIDLFGGGTRLLKDVTPADVGDALLELPYSQTAIDGYEITSV